MKHSSRALCSFSSDKATKQSSSLRMHRRYSKAWYIPWLPHPCGTTLDHLFCTVWKLEFTNTVCHGPSELNRYLFPITYCLLRKYSQPSLHRREEVVGNLAHTGSTWWSYIKPLHLQFWNAGKGIHSLDKEIWTEDNTNAQWLKGLFLCGAFFGNLLLSNASHGPLSSRPWARKKLHEGAQEESKWYADTFPEYYPKLLTFMSCRLSELLMVSSYWRVLNGLKLDKLMEEKSSAQNIMQQEIP